VVAVARDQHPFARICGRRDPEVVVAESYSRASGSDRQLSPLIEVGVVDQDGNEPRHHSFGVRNPAAAPAGSDVAGPKLGDSHDADDEEGGPDAVDDVLVPMGIAIGRFPAS
jgi:hypothetical protein